MKRKWDPVARDESEGNNQQGGVGKGYFINKRVCIIFVLGSLESYAVADGDDGAINGNGDGRTRENMQRLGPII